MAVDLDALSNPRQDDFNIGELAQQYIGFDLIGVLLDDDVAAGGIAKASPACHQVMD